MQKAKDNESLSSTHEHQADYHTQKKAEHANGDNTNLTKSQVSKYQDQCRRMSALVHTAVAGLQLQPISTKSSYTFQQTSVW
jgi:hypothetical protein